MLSCIRIYLQQYSEKFNVVNKDEMKKKQKEEEN